MKPPLIEVLVRIQTEKGGWYHQTVQPFVALPREGEYVQVVKDGIETLAVVTDVVHRPAEAPEVTAMFITNALETSNFDIVLLQRMPGE
jgi:hypothetical protein